MKLSVMVVSFLLWCSTALAAGPCAGLIDSWWTSEQLDAYYIIVEPDCTMTVYDRATDRGVWVFKRHVEAPDCSGINYLLNIGKCRDVQSQGEPVERTCKFPVGSPDYCFSCGPCDVGEGGCNKHWQCKKGLRCFHNVCVDSP